MSDPLEHILLHFEDEAAAAAAAAEGITIESDSEKNREVNADGENVEKTSFQPGDPYHFLVYHTDEVYVSACVACAGTVFHHGMTTRSRDSVAVFTELNSLPDSPNKPSISYKPDGGLSQDWYQNYSNQFHTGSGISLADDLSLSISTAALPAQVKLTYSVRFRSFEFRPPNNLTLSATDESDNVDIYIVVYVRSV